MKPGRKQAPLGAYFAARYTVDRNGCWIWTGVRATNGYGVSLHASQSKPRMQAHRLSWELVNGPIPPGLVICHRCDIRPCVNPDHLFIGTQGDNIRDMVAKGRNYVYRPPHKVVCINGHSLTSSNLAIKSDGRHRCATCHREGERARKLRKAVEVAGTVELVVPATTSELRARLRK